MSKVAQNLEKDFTPNANFEKLIEKERTDSYKYGGMTVFGKATPKIKHSIHGRQLDLFD